MGAGASTEGVQGLPSDPSEWTTHHVELCLVSLKLEAFVPAARAVQLNGSAIEQMEAHPGGLATALSEVEFDDAAAQKMTDALVKFRRRQPEVEAGHSAQDMQSAVEIIREGADSFPAPEFEDDDWTVLQVLFAHDKKVSVRPRDMAGPETDCKTKWWLLQCDVFAHTGHHTESCLVHIGAKDRIKREARQIRSLGPALGNHCPTLNSVAWINARGGVRLSLQGSLWAAPQLRATPHTPLLQTFTGLYNNRVWALLSGRISTAPVHNVVDDDDPEDEGSRNPSAQARAAKLAFGGSCGVSAALTAIIDDAIAPLLLTGRRRVPLNLFRHYNLECSLTEAIMMLEQIRDGKFSSNYATVDKMVQQHSSSSFELVRAAGGIIGFFHEFLNALVSSPQYHADELRPEPQEGDGHTSDGNDTSDHEHGDDDDVSIANDEMHARYRWIAPVVGTIDVQHILLELHSNHPIYRGNNDPGALCNAKLTSDGSGQAGGSADWGRGVRYAWLTQLAPESEDSIELERHVLEPMARLEVDLCCRCTPLSTDDELEIDQALGIVDTMVRLSSLSEPIVSALTRERQLDDAGQKMKAKFQLLWLAMRQIRYGVLSLVGNDQDSSQYNIALLSHALKHVSQVSDTTSPEGSVMWAIICAVTTAAAVFKSLQTGVRATEIASCDAVQYRAPLQRHAYMHEVVKHLHVMEAIHMQFDDPFLQTLVGTSSLPTTLVRSPLSIAKAVASASNELSGDGVDFKVENTALKIDDEEDALSHSLVVKGLGPLESALQEMFPGITLTFGQTFAIVSNQGTGRTMALRRMVKVAATKMLQWHSEKTTLIDQAIQVVHTIRKKRRNTERKRSGHGNEGSAENIDGENWSVEQLYDVIEDSATFGSDMLVPLFIPLKEVATLAFYRNANVLNDDLIALWIHARYGTFAAAADHDDFAGARNNALVKRGRMLLAALASRKVLLFLDGLDEVPVLHSEMCEYIMSRLPGQKHAMVVFSTCLQAHMTSKTEYSLLDSCEQFNLLPLDSSVKLAVVNARAQMMARQGIPPGNMSLAFASSNVLSKARDLISRKLDRESSPFELAAVIGTSFRFTPAQLSADPLLSPLRLSAAEIVHIAVQLQLLCAISERQLASSQRVQKVLSRSIQFVNDVKEDMAEMHAIQGGTALRLLQQVAYEMHKRRTRVASITHVETAATEHEISSGMLEILCKHVQLNKIQMLKPMSTEIATEIARIATKTGRSRGHIVQPVMYQLGSHLCLQQHLAAQNIVNRLVGVAQRGSDETGLPANLQENVEAGETTEAIKAANQRLEAEIRSVFSDDHSWEAADDHDGTPEALALLRDPWWQPVILISASLLPEWLWVEVMRVAVAHDRTLLSGLYSYAIFNADFKTVQALKECDVVVPEHILTPDDETGMLPLHSACADVQPSAALVEVLIEVYPQACTIRDKARGRLPIHYACDARFPSERMIHALLEREPGTTKVRDASGCLPFHYICKACSDSSFKQLVQAVLECNPDAAREANHEGRTALHFACMANKPSDALICVLLDLVPDSSCAIDQVHERMPIHYMCDSERDAVSCDTVIAMLTKAPESAVHPDKDGYIPLDILLRQDSISTDAVCAMVNFIMGTNAAAGEEGNEKANILLDRNEILMRAMKFLFTHPRPTVETVQPMLFAVKEIKKDADKILKSISADMIVGAEAAAADKAVVVPIEAAVELFLVMPEGSIAVRDNWGQHPLHWTCANEIKIGARGAQLDTLEGQLQTLAETVDALLKIDPDGAQIVDKQGRLPLHYACLNPYPCASAIEALMQAFPEASSSKDVKGMTPLHYLCCSNRATAAMVQSLIAFNEETAEEEAEHEMLPLHFACKVASESSDWAQAVQALIEANPHGPRATDAGGNLPLHFACSTQPLNEAIILLLLQSYAEGAEETADGAGGKLPLHLLCASRRPSERLVHAMLDAYPDATQESDMMAGRLPVHYACENRFCSSGIVRLLLGAHPSCVEEADELAGRLPVHWLCRQPDLDIELLQDVYDRYNESLEVMDETGMLPLHIACGLRRPNEAVVRFLLEKFPEGVTTRDSQTNLLPLEMACDSSLLPKSIIRACLEIEDAPEEHFELAKQAVKASEKTNMNAYFEVAAVVRSVQWERNKLALTGD